MFLKKYKLSIKSKVIVLILASVMIFMPKITDNTYRYERAGTGEVRGEIKAYITGYNTVPEQTDSTPCISADGSNICGRDDTVACPRSLELGTKIGIRGKIYTCADRLAKKYDDRFDVNCDKDFKCPNQVTGMAIVSIY